MARDQELVGNRFRLVSFVDRTTYWQQQPRPRSGACQLIREADKLILDTTYIDKLSHVHINILYYLDYMLSAISRGQELSPMGYHTTNVALYSY